MKWPYQLVLQFRGDSLDDHDAMIALEDDLITELQGLAKVDGYDMGAGEANRFILTSDPRVTLTCEKTHDLPPEFERLRKKLSEVGWIALGSLVERDKPGQGGPRYQWSRRVGPKPVTVALSAEQFAWLKQAITNQREVWDILMELQQLTARHALENLPGPPRRKRRSKKRLGLN